MADPRPTRWEKAKADWSGLRAKREVVVGVVGAVAAAGAQALAGSAGAVDTLIAGGVGAVVTVVVFPLVELGWRWVQAPMRLLTEDVIAIRERVEQLDVRSGEPSTPQEPIDLRLTLLNQVRIGREIANSPAMKLSGDIGKVDAWTQGVITTLNEHVSAERAEEFMAASEKTGRFGLQERVEFLAQFADSLERG